MQHVNDDFDVTRVNVGVRSWAAPAIPMGVVFLAAAFVLAGGGCASDKPQVLRTDCPSLDADDYYFPAKALDSRTKIDKMLQNWYGGYLKAMMEPSISCGVKPNGYAYRFLWLRSAHHPIAVRVQKDGSSALLVAVELAGDGEHTPGKILHRSQRLLSPTEEKEFLTKMKLAGYWEMPKNQDRFGAEGAEWIVEGAENGQYQVIERWSPKAGPYRSMCQVLLDLAGFRISELDTY